ncbi:polysaccharide biosynthesis/export family protein [Larsenimonas rhizosphaerae]|uniref:Polysaccharide export protein n=1 Tax=Larsenimonas rhizosphaerae TaxID=2944682 RepID=A0AA41ZKF3_9GAMM|nr:polysaccharide biosynthesis/export family protein [Larsenimonas rhizosphaerae]MCM2130911.1 polysaccharide export protein [Larsenimonas rhizosphaerae]MCX2523616.1 polysaccharide export protein [Larsenimonas rhizosphaerae]
MNARYVPILLALMAMILGGCTPVDRASVSPKDHWQHSRLWSSEVEQIPSRPARLEQLNAQRLSAGDRITITVAAGDNFNGRYEIDHDGRLRLPWLTPIEAVGKSAPELAEAIRHQLESEGMFRSGLAYVTVQLHSWAPISVRVEGAVFNPGRVDISARSALDRSERQSVASGEAGTGRRLSNALAAAGGIRPDADITRVVLIRNDIPYSLDLAGFIDGTRVIDPFLRDGDRLVIGSTGHFSSSLMRPMPITLPGIKIFASNLTQPASSNGNSNLGEDAMAFPYGTRLLQAAIKANCIGGIQTTSGNRNIVLISENPMTRKPVILSRNSDALMAHSNDAGINPWLMPGDTLSCYDSGVTNLRDIAKVLTEIVVPFSLF